jgi:hypothetical protein
MAKRKVICPECGYQFDTVYRGVQGQTAGVRFTRTTEGQFQTTIDMPGEIIERQKYYTTGDHLLGALVIGVSAGALSGYFISIPWHVSEPGIAAEIILGSTLTGWATCNFWLIRMRAWEMCKALPMAVSHYLALAKGKMQDKEDLTFTIDHRYRDAYTEAGRTTQRFGPLPVDVERFNEWVQGALVGKSLGVGHWTPETKMFKRPEYDSLLAMMREGGIIINLGSNKGNTLTGGGRRALTKHLRDCGITPPSPPSEDFLGERLAQAVQLNGGNTPLPSPEKGVCNG